MKIEQRCVSHPKNLMVMSSSWSGYKKVGNRRTVRVVVKYLVVTIVVVGLSKKSTKESVATRLSETTETVSSSLLGLFDGSGTDSVDETWDVAYDRVLERVMLR